MFQAFAQGGNNRCMFWIGGIDAFRSGAPSEIADEYRQAELGPLRRVADLPRNPHEQGISLLEHPVAPGRLEVKPERDRPLGRQGKREL